MTTRKTIFVRERITAEAGSPAVKPICRVAAVGIVANPFAGRFVEDLSPLFEIALALGEDLMPQAVAMLEGAPLAYGKAAIVGVNGDIEHAAAAIHPTLGKPMREAVGGGESIIPHVTKVGAAGTAIDVPLANKDNIWSFDDFETITVMVADAPRPDEIMIVMAIADGGRPHPRIGKGRAVT